jgi:hypothetical protein
MRSQRIRSWVAESNSMLSQHDKGHGKGDLEKLIIINILYDPFKNINILHYEKLIYENQALFI